MRRSFPQRLLALALLTVVLQHSVEAQDGNDSASSDLVAAVDARQEKIAKNIADLQTVVVIDHARLAKKAGVPMPPSVVTIFSDPTINSSLMKVNPRIGVDLPFKVLAYGKSSLPQRVINGRLKKTFGEAVKKSQ